MLGLNGAGKTTFLKLILGFIYPSEGSIEILGHAHLDPSIRRQIGYLPENPSLYTFLTVQQLLSLCGQLYGLSRSNTRQRTQELLELLGADAYANRRIGELSKGMTQRLAIASSLMATPELVLLDEPLSGLDPVGRNLVKGLLQTLKKRGTTVFFSSHILLEVEQICDRVSILHQGKLIHLEDMAAVRKRFASLDDFFIESIQRPHEKPGRAHEPAGIISTNA